MKKRTITYLIIGFMLLLLAGGCSKGASNNQAGSGPQGVQNSQQNSTANPGNQGARPKADVFGQVKSISGNDVTIALAQIPQRNSTSSGDKTQTPAPSQDQSKGPGQNRMSSMQLTGETKTLTIPEGTKILTGGLGNPGNNKPSGQNSNSGQSASPGQNAAEIKLGDVKAGDIISVYYKTGTQTIDYVRIMRAKK